MSDTRIPRATYRLQMTRDFPFAAAMEIVPYLARLGVSHLYLSPILKARRGSTHGYDTVDHTQINPELGTRADFQRLAETCKQHGLGIVADIVPNHMGIGGDENALWLDVLEWGQQSRYADWFDIDWSPRDPSLHGKVLVPFLARSFAEALERGQLELRYDVSTRTYAVWAEGVHELPVCPDTYPIIGGPEAVARLNSPGGREDFVRLIEAQHWRPARFSVAADEINYRRFFIVSDLAAIRIERDDVFDHVHKLTFDLVRDGLIDGLRVDHVDGLYDPKAYCLKLRRECPRDIYLVVEKILAPHEQLRADWGVDGTTGYEFGAVVTRLLTEPKAEPELTRGYTDFTGRHELFADVERNAKREIIDFEMAAELDALVRRLAHLAHSARRTADLTANALRLALRETIAAMPVYRTYVESPLADEDKRNIAVAISHARKALPALDPAALDFLCDVMAGELPAGHPDYDAATASDLARRIQQFTGPVMAKGLEDTALYRDNRLLALADVGARPDRFSASIAAFHDFNRACAAATPHGMLATTTHDTKRGEDTRARIAALTGDVPTWLAAVGRWTRMLADAGAPAIDPNDSWAFFQLLLGAWPATWAPDTPVAPSALAEFRDRMQGAMQKSVREARLHTNWTRPNASYEDAVTGFVDAALRPSPFLDDFRGAQDHFSHWIGMNGLVQTVLKFTVPGIPDIYQGAELWEQSLVDPDNRRPVDFSAREALLRTSEAEPLAHLLSHWRDGAIKQRVIVKLLALRARQPGLFAHGTYEPLTVPNASNVVAFLRRDGDAALLVAIRLYPWRTVTDGGELSLPPDLRRRLWFNALDDMPASPALPDPRGALRFAVLIAN